MKDLKDRLINEASANLCTFNGDKLDNEKLGDLFIEFGEALKKNSKAKEISISEYGGTGGEPQVIDLRIKDSSYNECFRKKCISGE
jgi:hypothetical protein